MNYDDWQGKKVRNIVTGNILTVFDIGIDCVFMQSENGVRYRVDTQRIPGRYEQLVGQVTQ